MGIYVWKLELSCFLRLPNSVWVITKNNYPITDAFKNIYGIYCT